MFSFFKRKKAPAPQESAAVQAGIPESADAPEVAPVAPTELPDTWAAQADGSAPGAREPASAMDPAPEAG
ncbi:hypothetical protein [Castellaniella ginsengisoli]